MRGRVKNFDEQKGFGFIEFADEPDVFVHFSGIEGTGHKVLHPGETVDLVIVQGIRGPQAAHVTVVEDENEEGTV